MLPRRRWLQFSLRSALLLMTAACIWLGWRVARERRVKEAIAAIEAMGGTWGSGTHRGA